MPPLDWKRASAQLLHPTVVRVLELCEQQARSPRQIADLMQVPLGAVSYHVRTLVAKDVLILVDTRPRRGAIEHFYVLSAAVQRAPASNGSKQGAGSRA